MSTSNDTENKARIILSKDFDIETAFDINHRPAKFIFTVDVGLNNKKFPQPSLSQEREVDIFFRPLDQDESIADTILLAAVIQENLSLTLRGLYALMKNEDNLLQSVSGKRIIIPCQSDRRENGKHRIIVFEPVYGDRAVWEVELMGVSGFMNGRNAVMPIVTY